MNTEKILAWHFVPDSRILQHEGGKCLAVEPGYIYSEDSRKLIICQVGLHASRRVYGALNFAAGSQLCRVRIWGAIAEEDDKIVGRHREVLAVKDVASELRLWGCWCVRNTPISGGKTIWDLLTDERSRNAVEVAEKFARGEATSEQLSTAWAAAWDAAWVAAAKFQADELERRMLALFGRRAR